MELTFLEEILTNHIREFGSSQSLRDKVIRYVTIYQDCGAAILDIFSDHAILALARSLNLPFCMTEGTRQRPACFKAESCKIYSVSFPPTLEIVLVIFL